MIEAAAHRPASGRPLLLASGSGLREARLGPKRMGDKQAPRRRSTQHAADVGAPGVRWRAAPETARAAAWRLSTEETASRVEEGTP
jgi:hypothetical protein